MNFLTALAAIGGDSLLSTIILIVIIVVVLIVIFSFVPIGLWISALAAGAKVGIFDLIGMRLRRVAPAKNCQPID